MLAMTRKPQDVVAIYTSDGPIYIEIKRIKGQQVSLAFDAPDDVEIVREVNPPVPA